MTEIKKNMIENVSRPDQPLAVGDRFRRYDEHGNYTEGVLLPVEAPKVRRITPRAFVARLRPWWPLVEYLKTNSSDFRLDWVLLEMAGYVDLDAQDNLEAFGRLKTAFEQIAGTAVPGDFPEFTLEVITQDGTEREAYTGPL